MERNKEVLADNKNFELTKNQIQRLLVISAPSGAGKSTMIAEILPKFEKLIFSISTTTRPKRPNEIHGYHYYFVSQDAFIEKINNNDFIEYALVHNRYYYGTAYAEINRITKNNRFGLLDIDVQGFNQLLSKFSTKPHSLFILPPDLNEARQRIEKRGTESSDIIDQRMKTALVELSHQNEYDYLIVNKEITKAVDDFVKILLEIFPDLQ